MAARSLSLKELRAECAALERVVLARRHATTEELAPHRPGGAENPDRGPRGWLRFYGVLHRRQAPAEAATAADHALSALLTSCSTEASRTITLSVTDERAQPRVVQVYPKSRRALAWLHARDCRVQWLGAGYRLLREHATPDEVAEGLFERTAEAYSYHLTLLVWSAITPGPWLPFNPADDAPEYPAWLDLLTPADTLAIREQFRQLNEKQLALLAHEIGGLEPTGSGTALPLWASCVVQIAESEGVDPIVLDRDRALVAILAGVFIRAKAREEATAEADARAR